MSNDNLPKPNFSTRNSGQAYQKLSESLADSPDAEKIQQDKDLGTLDDHVDIDDPHYNEAATKNLERELAAKDGIEPLPEDPELEVESITYAIENPSDPNPF